MKKKNSIKNTWIVALVVLLLIGLLFSSSVAAEEEWHKEDIGTGNGGMYEVDVGQGRNDDVMRVYGGTYNRSDRGRKTSSYSTGRG